MNGRPGWTIHLPWLAALALCTTLVVRAEHGSPWVEVHPGEDRLLPTNALIYFTSNNGVSVYLAELVAKKHKARATLVGGGQVIALKVIDRCDDAEYCIVGEPCTPFEPDMGYGHAELVLKPEHAMKPETSYDLVVDSPAWGPDEEPLVLATWKTSSGKDLEGPAWRGKPRYEMTTDEQILGYEAYEEDAVPLIMLPLEGETILYHVIITARPVKSGKKRRMLRTIPVPTKDELADGPWDSRCRWVHAWATNNAGKAFDLEIKVRDVTGKKKKAPGPPLRVKWPENEQGFLLCLDLQP